jgi:hypothetical protein
MNPQFLNSHNSDSPLKTTMAFNNEPYQADPNTRVLHI